MFSLRMDQNSLIWHALRSLNIRRVSSSELAPVFHMGKFKSKRQLFLDKKGKGKPSNFSSQATEHGRTWEQVPIRMFMDEVFPEERWEYRQPGTVLDPHTPLCCSPDMMFFHRKLNLVHGLEVKCPYSTALPLKKEDIINQYLFQCFACLMITGADSWFLCYYDAKLHFRIAYEMFPDRTFWLQEIVPRVQQFLAQVQDSASQEPKRKDDKGEKGENQATEKKYREKLLELVRPFNLYPRYLREK